MKLVYLLLYDFHKKQECIPVGCVLPAHWPSGGGEVVGVGGCSNICMEQMNK